MKQDVDGKYEFTENFKEAELFFQESVFMAAMSWAYYQPDTTHVRKDRETVDMVNELGLMD